MNRVRRIALEKLEDKLLEIQDALEILKDEEEEYRDNIPENLQGSERYEKADDACYALDDALESLYNVIEQIQEARA